MPELNWIGKQAVRAHHREVDFHLLKDVPELACEGGAGTPARSGEADMSVRAPLQDGGNLIVQGDNLRALKALLPRYAGQVKCIYIDPPYNTGNEGWVYNDNVKAPEMVKWLGQVVGKEAEDLCRHDKWLCMMYPRLQLLKRFLREDGSIWVSIDDNEVASLRLLMDEVFGRTNFLGNVIWQKKYSPQNDALHFSDMHDHILVYGKNAPLWDRKLIARTEKQDAAYKNPDNDSRGPWKPSDLTRAEHRDRDFYAIVTPTGKEVYPARGRSWSRPPEEIERLRNDNRLWFGKAGDAIPSLKRFISEVKQGVVPTTLWYRDEVGDNQEAKQELKSQLDGDVFATPKPTRLIQRILQIATDKDSLVLDSFAGSGTTGHAVLKQNAEDGGTRRFILVEMEEKIARTITAERVRRVVERSAGTPARPASEETTVEVEAEAPSEAGELDLFAASAAKKPKKKRTGVSAPPTEGQAEEPAGPMMPGFRFAVLGETLFDAEGNIRETVTFDELAEFVWFQQTGAPMPPKPTGERTPLLGIHRGAAVYLLYNGILKDKSVGGGNVLTRPVLYSLPPHDGPKVVWCAACRISELILRRMDVTPRQIPYQLEVNAWL